jgi:hypothetical protein
MNIFAKLLQDKRDGVKPKPFTHPKLEADYYRIFFDDIKATTDKAVLFKLEDGRKMWIARSNFIMRYGRQSGVTESDRNDCIDVISWFYENEIENKHRKG